MPSSIASFRSRKPTTFATNVWQKGSESRPVYVFGLPGNPVSAWVTAQLYVLPTIRTMMGFSSPKATGIPARVRSTHAPGTCQNVYLSVPLIFQMTEDFTLDPRPEFVRAVFVPPTRSDTTVVPSAVLTDSNQMSSRLLSNRQANLLLMLPQRTQDQTMVRAGDIVQAMVIGHL